MPIPIKRTTDDWFDDANLSHDDLVKGQQFVEPLRSRIDPARYYGRHHALIGLMVPEFRAECPAGMDFHAYLAGKNEERHDLAARPI